MGCTPQWSWAGQPAVQDGQKVKATLKKTLRGSKQHEINEYQCCDSLWTSFHPSTPMRAIQRRPSLRSQVVFLSRRLLPHPVGECPSRPLFVGGDLAECFP